MTALATLEQLAARATQAFDEARATAVLDDVSAAVRNYTGQTVTAETTTDRFVVRNFKVRLPQRPVSEVSDVSDIDGAALTYSWDGLETIVVPRRTVDQFDYDVPLISPPVVDVTYSHGYETVPDDLVAVVCNVAARALAEGPEMAGVTQESVVSYSVSYGPIGASGPLGFFAAETRVLDRYRRAGVTWQATS